MKKIVLIITTLLITSFSSFAQDKTTPSTPPQYENIFEQMKEMQQKMMKRFGGKADSTESSDDMGMNFPNMKMDSSFSKSFGMLFDGKEWKSMMPNDSTMNGMMRGFGGGFDMSEMFKGFEKMFGGDAENMQTLPKGQPKDKKRRDEGDKKEKKYKTEDL